MKSTTTQIYASSEATSNELLKPVTNEANKHAPQEGIHFYQTDAAFYPTLARLTLHEKQVKYEDHSVYIMTFDHYQPWYVRMNPRMVVPTLVVDGKVTTDALNIMKVIDHDLGDETSPRLTPQSVSEQKLMNEFLDLQYSLFVEAISFTSMECVPDKRPWFWRKVSTFRDDKIPTLTKLRDQNKDHDYLYKAYATKIELCNAIAGTQENEDNMQKVADDTRQKLAKLAHQLESGPFNTSGGWLVSDSFTLADIAWSATFQRFVGRGLDEWWMTDHPIIQQYIDKLHARPAFLETADPKWPFLLGMVWRKIQYAFGF